MRWATPDNRTILRRRKGALSPGADQFSILCPQNLQKDVPGRVGFPHVEQYSMSSAEGSPAPHLRQNREPSPFAVLHAGHTRDTRT